MEHTPLGLDQVALRLGKDRREVEKLLQRGTLPGRKIGGEWTVHPAELTRWLEQEIRGYGDEELEKFEERQRGRPGTPAADDESESPLARYLSRETVQVPLEARTRRSVIESLLETAGRTWQVWEPAALLKAVLEREEVHSTAFPNGVAIPHPRSPLPEALGESVIAMGRTLSGVPFGGPQRSLTDVFFLVLCRDSRTHLRALARIGRLLQQPGFLEELRACPDSQSTWDWIMRSDAKLDA
jgi:PTS system nitrogen regulatory IIA component